MPRQEVNLRPEELKPNDERSNVLDFPIQTKDLSTQEMREIKDEYNDVMVKIKDLEEELDILKTALLPENAPISTIKKDKQKETKVLSDKQKAEIQDTFEEAKKQLRLLYKERDDLEKVLPEEKEKRKELVNIRKALKKRDDIEPIKAETKTKKYKNGEVVFKGMMNGFIFTDSGNLITRNGKRAYRNGKYMALRQQV